VVETESGEAQWWSSTGEEAVLLGEADLSPEPVTAVDQ
jgi:hypothetical protein